MARIQEINQYLEALRPLLLPLGLVGIRLGYLTTDSDRSRRVLVLDRHGATSRYALISPRPQGRAAGIKALVHHHPIDAPVADQILDLAHELSELNDMGAWPLVSTTRDSVFIGPDGIEGTPFSDHPGFWRRYHNLCGCFPGVERILFTAHIGESKKGSSRKVWMSFRGADGIELAAVAVNHMATMLRDWYGPEDAAHSKADANLGRWAHQLGVSLDYFMDAALDLVTFDTMQQVTEIRLEPPK